MTEEWKTVVYDGEIYSNYEISNFGNIRNVKRKTLLHPSKRKNGYLQVLLYKDGKRKIFLVHRIVAFTFIPNNNQQEKPDVNHKDENKENNRIDNLEWCSKQYNIDYSQSKKVLCIETGIIYKSTREASRETGFAQNGIWECCNEKQKTCGGYRWKYVN